MSKPKPRVPVVEAEVLCSLCSTVLDRSSGPLMCPNRECPAWRGKG